MGSMASEWTPERLARAKALYLKGRTAAQIAASLGGVTRNAVIGIVHRKKWNEGKRPNPPAAPKLMPPKRAERLVAAQLKPVGGRGFVSAPVRPRGPSRPVTLPPPAKSKAPVHQAELKVGQCRFPLWPHFGPKPAPADRFYCGAPVQADGSSWCADCAAIVFAERPPAKPAPHPSHPRS